MAQKSRFFTGIVFEDSAPEDWRDELENSLGMWLISPLHEPDVQTPEEEEFNGLSPKLFKRHWHVMYCHGNTIGWKAAKELFPDWVFVHKDPNKFMVSASRNLSRYFLHMDQPEKQQFEGDPFELLTCFNGFPLCLERQLTAKQERDLQIAIQVTITDRNIFEFHELCDYLRTVQDWEAYDYVQKHVTWADKYITSLRNFHINKAKEEHVAALAKSLEKFTD